MLFYEFQSCQRESLRFNHYNNNIPLGAATDSDVVQVLAVPGEDEFGAQVLHRSPLSLTFVIFHPTIGFFLWFFSEVQLDT